MPASLALPQERIEERGDLLQIRNADIFSTLVANMRMPLRWLRLRAWEVRCGLVSKIPGARIATVKRIGIHESSLRCQHAGHTHELIPLSLARPTD